MKLGMEAGMKNQTCSACGQTLPLRVGDFVESRNSNAPWRIQGIVTGFLKNSVNVLQFTGGTVVTYPDRLVRLHGYLHITEREVLSR